MGTTLTGTTPQDTYDSLIKVTDNGPLSGSLKKLTDGLGNDSALSLSTGAASITGTLAVSSNGLFGGSTNAGNAGTNTISVGVAGTSTGGLQLWAGSAQTHYVQFGDGTTGAQPYAGYVGYNHTADSLIFGSASADRLTITSAGNVGIGTSSPTQKLTVNGNAAVGGQQAFWLRDDDGFSSGVTRRAWAITANYANLGTFSIYGASAANSDPLAGTPFLNITSAGVLDLNQGQIKFPATQVPSADANTLDDYEEGTWTMAVTPSTSGTITLDAGVNQGRYTKIGRQVMVQGLAEISSVSSPVGTSVLFSGLPFAIASPNVDYNTRVGGSVALYGAGGVLPRALTGLENQAAFDVWVDASTLVSGNQFYISFTYTV